MSRGSPGKKARRTQAERSAETQGRLLRATVASLVEVGYAETTTLEVGRRAGLPRGTQLHHYPNKADLLVAAVEYLADERMQKIHDELGPLLKGESRDRVELVFDVLWSSFTGPLFWAALELVVGSRTDVELRAKFHAMERRVTGRILAAIETLTGGTSEEAKAAFALTLYVMNGMAIERITSPDDRPRRRLMEYWKARVRSAVSPLPRSRGARRTSELPSALGLRARARPTVPTSRSRRSS